MWLLSYITKNSLEAPEAAKGNVYDNGTSVAASGEHRSLRACLPYGFGGYRRSAGGRGKAKLRRRREHCAEKRRQSADKRQGGLR